MDTLLCIGLGYTAQALVRTLPAARWAVRGTSRDPAGGWAGGRSAAASGTPRDRVPVSRFGRGAPPPPAFWTGATHLLVSAAPDAQGDPVLDTVGDVLRGLPGLRWVGYLSTTGVYGDHGGGWVDESTPPAPSSPRTRRRVEAEGAWLASGLPVHVFRLAGIYGPGRSAVDQLLAGTARRIVKPGQVFSRSHVDDIARVLAASLARPAPGTVYNVCDDEPAPADEVVAYAAACLGVAAPPPEPFDQAALSPMARSFYADNRRVRNRRIREELGVELAYPTYREGIRALVAGLPPAERGRF